MAVRIRLKKMGRKHRPFYRVCAMDSRTPRNGRVIEELGTYDPMVPETDARAILNGERISYWLGVGALPTPKVGVLIKKYGKDGTHLDQQQQALNRLAARRSDAIASATKEAAAIAATAPPPKVESEPQAGEDAAATVDESAEAPAESSDTTRAEAADTAEPAGETPGDDAAETPAE